MKRSVEIKARIPEARRAAIRELAAALAGSPPEIIDQTDTFFRASHGRLKLREFAADSGELISYSRPDATGPRTSSYVVAPVSAPGALKAALAAALGVRGVVRKRRELFLVDRTRVHVDDVDGLGCFLELEVVLRDGQSAAAEGEATAARLMEALGVRAEDLVASAYIDLLEASGR